MELELPKIELKETMFLLGGTSYNDPGSDLQNNRTPITADPDRVIDPPVNELEPEGITELGTEGPTGGEIDTQDPQDPDSGGDPNQGSDGEYPPLPHESFRVVS